MQVDYFDPLTFGMTVPLFAQNIYKVKGRFFNKIRILTDHLYLLKTKSSKIIPNVVR